MINGIIGVIVNITMSIILSRSIGIFGIALGDSIAYFILMFLSYFALRKSNTQISKMFGLSSILQIMFASGVSFLVGAFVNGACENINIYFSGIVSAVVSVVCFYSFLNIIRCRELLDLQNTLISRIVLWYNKKRK